MQKKYSIKFKKLLNFIHNHKKKSQNFIHKHNKKTLNFFTITIKKIKQTSYFPLCKNIIIYVFLVKNPQSQVPYFFPQL